MKISEKFVTGNPIVLGDMELKDNVKIEQGRGKAELLILEIDLDNFQEHLQRKLSKDDLRELVYILYEELWTPGGTNYTIAEDLYRRLLLNRLTEAQTEKERKQINDELVRVDNKLAA